MRQFRYALAALLLAAAAEGWAQYAPLITALPGTVPGTVHYQGRLEDNGFPAQGNRNMRFRLYDAAGGGTLLFDSGTLPVSVNIGIFGVDLNIPISVLQGAASKFLEVQVEAAILTPRERLAAVPYALIAKTIEGSLDISNGGLTISHTPTATTPSFIVSSTTTFVGIGTINPATKLHMSSGTFTIDGTGGPSIVASSSVVAAGGILASTITGNPNLFLNSQNGASSVILEIGGIEGARLDSSRAFRVGAAGTQSQFNTNGSLDLVSGSTVAFNGTLTLSTATVGTTGLPAILVDRSGNVVVGSTGSLGGLSRMLTLVSENPGNEVGLELMGNRNGAAQSAAGVSFLNRPAAQASRSIAGISGRVGQAGDLDSGQLVFVTANAAGTLSPNMALNEDGELGIGNVDPQRRLDVTGDAQFGNAGAKSSFATTGALTMANATNITVSGGGKLVGLPATCSATTTDAASEGCVATTGGGWQRTGTQVHTRTAGDAVTVWQGSMTVQDTLAIDRNIAASDASYLRLFRQGTERARIGLDSNERLALMAGASDSPAMRINGTGQVGIGAAPGALLQVGSGGVDAQLRLGSDLGSFRRILFFDTSGVPTKNNFEIAQQEVDNSLFLGPSTAVGGTTFNTATGVTIDSTGRVGIGDSSPEAALEASRNASFPLLLNREDAAGNRAFVSFKTAGIRKMGIALDATDNLYFYEESAPNTPILGVSRAGSVGVGTTTPGTKLHMSSGTLTVDGTGALVTVEATNAGIRLQQPNPNHFPINLFSVVAPTLTQCSTQCGVVRANSICLGGWRNDTSASSGCVDGALVPTQRCLCAGP